MTYTGQVSLTVHDATDVQSQRSYMDGGVIIISRASCFWKLLKINPEQTSL